MSTTMIINTTKVQAILNLCLFPKKDHGGIRIRLNGDLSKIFTSNLNV